MSKYRIIISIFLLLLITSTAFAKPKVLIIPIENGGYSNHFEQLKAYNTILYKDLLNSGVLYPVQAKDSGLVLTSVKPRQTKFKNQSNSGIRAFIASQTQEVAKKHSVDYLLHSNVISYDGYTIHKSSENGQANYPTVSGTIGVSIIRPGDASIIWYYESNVKTNTSNFRLPNGIYGGRQDVDDALFYSLLEKISSDIVKRMKQTITVK